MRTASHASWLIVNFLLLGHPLNAADVVEVAVQSRVDREPPLTSPFGIDFDAAGDLYFVELTGQRVRKLDRSGALSTVAGTGRKGNSGDGGPAREAEFNG